MKTKEYELELGGKKVIATFSDLVDQASGAVMLKCDQTIVLATVVMSKEEKKGLDFFNLTVDYIERFYAGGEILGGRFMHREGKPSDKAVLNGRIIDRTIRPLFNQQMKYAVQVAVTVLSLDENDPTALAVNAVSMALMASDIPWNGPVGAVRVGKINGELVVNALREKDLDMKDRSDYDFEMFICGKDGNVNMIEANAYQVQEAEIKEALEVAVKEIGKLENWQREVVKTEGKKKREVVFPVIREESVKLFDEEIAPKLEAAIFSGPGNEKTHELQDSWKKMLKEKFPEVEDFSLENDYFEEKVNDMLHAKAIKEDKRPDGRKMDELRSLFAQAGNFSEIIHGSGIFYRGGTHVFSVLTLGGPESRQLIDGMEQKANKRFMHHYNFPPYSTGEVGRLTMTGRREIGHGALAEKALQMVLPPREIFPYTIRVVSETMASNGSSSMGSVCAGTLALMDGGVPILAPVAGIAMGLMYQDDKNYKVLTDIQGPEDHHGDMDFKVAGTEHGVTAVQMDVKVDGVPVFVLAEALAQAKQARLNILEVIKKEIAAPRAEICKHAPKILTMKVKIDQIGLVIGPGGKTINGIKDKTGAEITIEDDGSVFVTGKDGSAEAALKIIEELTHEHAIGEQFTGEVIRIVDFGAFVKIAPMTEGLVHISEMAPFRVNKVTDFLHEGDMIPVKIVKIDDQGKIGLSIKEVDPNFIKKPDDYAEFAGNTGGGFGGGRPGGFGGGNRGDSRGGGGFRGGRR